MERHIEGPEPYAARLTSQQGGQWIGEVGDEAFDDLMATHLPTVRPIYVGKKKFWNWMDAAILGYIIGRGLTKSPQEKRSKDDTGTEK